MPTTVGTRIAVPGGVKKGGCAGMSYYMECAEKIDPLDERFEDKGVGILVDPNAVLFLLGNDMDYKIEKLSAQLACDRGESVQIGPASEAS
jgi:iron-sulfur cluster assembly protein